MPPTNAAADASCRLRVAEPVTAQAEVGVHTRSSALQKVHPQHVVRRIRGHGSDCLPVVLLR